MTSVEELREKISLALDEEEKVREESFTLSREVIRKCRRYISDLVEGGGPDDHDLRSMTDDLVKRSISAGDRRFPFVEDALVEVAEETILKSVLNGHGLPDLIEVGVSERAYILGACDTVGELRRVILNKLLKKDLNGALSLYDEMKGLSHLVGGFTYPSGMIPLKKKQDVVRALMDRTAGELAISINSRNLRTEEI